MNRNTKIAKELIRIAKSLIADKEMFQTEKQVFKFMKDNKATIEVGADADDNEIYISLQVEDKQSLLIDNQESKGVKEFINSFADYFSSSLTNGQLGEWKHSGSNSSYMLNFSLNKSFDVKKGFFEELSGDDTKLYEKIEQMAKKAIGENFKGIKIKYNIAYK